MSQINASVASIGTPTQGITPTRGREGRPQHQPPNGKPKPHQTPPATETAETDEPVEAPAAPDASGISHLDIKG